MFKVIEDFPKYSINEHGDVLGPRGGILSKQVNIDGYFVVNIYGEGGKCYHRRCARLVGLTFLKDSYKEGMLINHIDLDKQNDHVSNLEWVEPVENVHHSLEMQPSVHRKSSDYSEELIRSVCEMIQNNISNEDILLATPLTRDTLLHIRCGNAWKWVSKDYNLTPSKRGVSEDAVVWACHRLNEDLPYKEILETSPYEKLTLSILKSIKCRKSWVKVSKHILKD